MNREGSTKKTLFEAFSFKYLEDDGLTSSVIKGPLASPEGRNSFQSRIKTRKSISLADSNITHADETQQNLGVLCPKLAELDLCDNLITNWQHVNGIIKGIDHLRMLNLSGNPINPATSELFEIPPSLRVLVFQRVNLTWNDICFLAGTNVEELHVSFNDISTFASGPQWPQLKHLTLYGNKVTDWKSSIAFFKESFPNLKTLILSANDLCLDTTSDTMDSLEYVALNKTSISAWEELTYLNSFVSLKELRLKEIPLFESLPPKACRYLIIGRMYNIEKLNGSIVSESERKDSEKYYLQQCYAELVELEHTEEKDKFTEKNPRYLQLLEKYGTPSLSGSNDNPDTLSAGLIQLVLTNSEGKEVRKELPYTITVKNLSIIVNHLFGIRPVDQILFYKRDSEDLEETILDDAARSLHFYGIVTGGTIFVRSK